MNKPKVKGTAFENEVRDSLLAGGFNSVRTGIIVGHPWDVEVAVPLRGIALEGNRTFRIECKRRARAWKDLYEWLGKNGTEFLAIRADNKKTLVVMPMELFQVLLSGRTQ